MRQEERHFSRSTKIVFCEEEGDLIVHKISVGDNFAVESVSKDKICRNFFDPICETFDEKINESFKHEKTNKKYLNIEKFPKKFNSFNMHLHQIWRAYILPVVDTTGRLVYSSF